MIRKLKIIVSIDTEGLQSTINQLKLNPETVIYPNRTTNSPFLRYMKAKTTQYDFKRTMKVRKYQRNQIGKNIPCNTGLRSSSSSQNPGLISDDTDGLKLLLKFDKTVSASNNVCQISVVFRNAPFLLCPLSRINPRALLYLRVPNDFRQTLNFNLISAQPHSNLLQLLVTSMTCL